MNNQPEIATRTLAYLNEGWLLALSWISSPAAWSQFALLLASWGIAILVSRRLGARISAFVAPPSGATGLFAMIRRFALRFMALLLPLLAY